VTPREASKSILGARVDAIFTQRTGFQSLNLALPRLHANKAELLLVLERPEIPLHNNLGENDICAYVKKRKISATTRSEAGRAARDTVLSLKKTCQKLGLSFWHYLQDRLTRTNLLPPLPTLIRTAAQPP
jgi:Transposase IS66 family